MMKKLLSEKGKRITGLVLIIISIIMVASFIMPYLSAKGDYKKYLKDYATEMNTEEIEMTNADAVNVSLYEFFRIYQYGWSHGQQKEVSALYTIMIGIVVVLSILILISALCRKPIAVIIFDIFQILVFRILASEFKILGLVKNGRYVFGVGYYIYYLSFIVAIVLAVVLLIIKINEKKLKRTIEKMEE